MIISIYHITFRHNGTANTFMQTVHVPNWFERVILRRKRTKANYLGHKTVWIESNTGKPMHPRDCKRLAAIEKDLQNRFPNKRILKFK